MEIPVKLAKRKLQRFSEVDTFRNVFTHSQNEERVENFRMKGKWVDYFRNNNALIVELGCGKGEYTVGLGTLYPEKNFIGIDLKGNRIWRGAKTAIEEKRENIGFVRSRIENIHTIFGKSEVDEIWVTFPDPQPQVSRERKRLTNPAFLEKYREILKPGGIVHLKTDNSGFYEYTLEVIKENGFQLLDSTPDLYAEPGKRDEALTGIQTYYEKKFSALGFRICYLKFRMQ